MLNSSKLFKGLGSILVASSLVVSPVIIGENMANAEQMLLLKMLKII